MLVTKQAGERIHRVGYLPDPWGWVPWEYIDHATGRWDDPEGTYRVLYAATHPLACFIEVLAQFRSDDALQGDMAAIEPDPRDDIYPTISPGTVPRSWFETHCIGGAALRGSFVDIDHMETIAELRPHFLARAVHYGLADFDAATIRLNEPRELTREISRFLYGYDHEGAPVDGIAYESRFGSALQLWAVFERAADADQDQSRLLQDVEVRPLEPDNPDFAAALALHGLVLGEP